MEREGSRGEAGKDAQRHGTGEGGEMDAGVWGETRGRETGPSEMVGWGAGRHNVRQKTTRGRPAAFEATQKKPTWHNCAGAAEPRLVQGNARVRGSQRVGSGEALLRTQTRGVGQVPAKDSAPSSHSPQDLRPEMGWDDLNDRHCRRSIQTGKDRTTNRGQFTMAGVGGQPVVRAEGISPCTGSEVNLTQGSVCGQSEEAWGPGER